MKSDVVDWKKLRERIAETPVIMPRKHRRHRNASPEAVEARRADDRERWRRNYHAKPEQYHAMQKAWEDANPEKVKAKRKRFYDSHKNDPEWMENHRRKNREYKARKRAEKLMLQQRKDAA